jgi:hypothetical protein
VIGDDDATPAYHCPTTQQKGKPSFADVSFRIWIDQNNERRLLPRGTRQYHREGEEMNQPLWNLTNKKAS